MRNLADPGGKKMNRHGIGLAKLLLLAGLCAGALACASNPFLQGYKVRTIEQEHDILAPRSAARADEVLAAKKSLRDNPRKPEAITALTSAYAGMAQEIGDTKDPLYDYCLEAAGYELKLYKARGGPLTPEVIAETGRNLYLRGRECQAERWLAKAIVINPVLNTGYGEMLAKSKAACAGRTK